jgi:signal transduction histidine kinase
VTRSQTVGYIGVVAGCFALAVYIPVWTSLARRVDNDAYDWMLRLYKPKPRIPQSELVVIDDATFQTMGGVRHLRSILAEGLELVAAGSPKAVAVDVILSDKGDPEEDARLAAACRRTPNLVLDADIAGQAWEDPLPEFRDSAVDVGHVYADPDPLDAVTRQLALEKVAGHRDRRWALALLAFGLSRGVPEKDFIESPADVQVGDKIVPARKSEMDGANESRDLRIRFLPAPIPRISVKELHDNPDRAKELAGKVVFLGVTSQSYGQGDRLFPPFSNGIAMGGLEIHANAFETLESGEFLTTARNSDVLAFCLLLAVGMGLAFGFRFGWQAYALAVLLLAIAHGLPLFLFTRGTVFPYLEPVSSAWFPAVGAAAFQHFVVRRRLRKSEQETARYRQAMHFVTHEMRTPLTAIQGSSELMDRYNLPEDKRHQIAQLINSESKRLAKMIETFLNVERLSAGQLELKKENFRAGDMLALCLQRAGPLAVRKRIRITLEPIPGDTLAGDRELMEYAFYNLITNAIKYSPADTEVTISGQRDGDNLSVSVKDQGIGMDEKELRNIFQKFYRTRKAEASGEAGTGIGLSIVEQIVDLHGGKISVASVPGKGSCFTLTVPAPVSACPAGSN